MGNSDKGKIKELAAAVNQTEAEYVKELVKAFNGKLMLAAMSIGVYPGALRYWLEKSEEKREHIS